MTTTTLLLIDVQKDFHAGGSLAIPTADDDALRIAGLIRANARKIHRVVATMDSHPKLHIAHPSFWWSNETVSQEQKQRHPDPFTVITADDVKQGRWKPRSDLTFVNLPPNQGGIEIDHSIFPNIEKVMNENGQLDIEKYCLEYVNRLEENGHFQLCIWPEHCLIGSPGHAIVDPIRDALNFWTEETGGSVEWVLKGQHFLTEMYSAIQADVPVTIETSYNKALVESLLVPGSRVLVCGQALSHCVNYTMRDIMDPWLRQKSNLQHATQIVLLTDCASPVPGFEAAAKTFVDDMQAKGVVLAIADQAFL